MLKLTLLSCLLFPVLLTAQIAPAIDLFDPVGDIQYTLAFDIDGDDDLDVVCATSERLFWLEQIEDGSFSHQRPIVSGSQNYRSLAYADIDEDGAQDLLYASQTTGLEVLINNGDGTFSQAMNIYNSATVIDLYIADFNNDQHSDIVIGCTEGVWWLSGNGDGSFGPALLVSNEHATATAVHAEDLDLDGDQDLVVAAFFSNRLSWHENLGDGTFGSFQIIDTTQASPTSVTTADFDDNGLPDIVCANRNEDEGGAGLTLYRNLGGSSFAAPDTLAGRGFHAYVEVADMDNDGDMDVVSCHGLDEMDWLENDGNGQFGPLIELERYAAYLRFVDLPDLNNDGFPDVLYGINSFSPTKENLLWRASTGGGNFAPPALLEIGARQLSIPVLADFDQDGLKDVVIGLDGSDALVWLRNEGQGFSTPHLIARRHNYAPNSIEVFDFNNDGWPDVLAGSIQDGATNSSYFCVYLNNGDGTFSETPPFQTNYVPQRDLQMVDMDADGDLDMLWASPGYNFLPNGVVGWVRNNGTDWGVPITLMSEVVSVLDVLATDLDADGQLDLIICKGDAPQLSRMEHTSNGNFTALQPITSDFTSAMYAQAADINEDGHLDLIASNDYNGGGVNKIAWWRNMGNGVLGSQQTIYSGNPPIEKFVVKDLDLDGRSDIITSSYLDEPMLFFQKQATGTFAAPVPIEEAPNAVRGFLMEDLDKDGDLDIIGIAEDEGSGAIDRLFVAYNLYNNKSLSGTVFYDLNANGLRDSSEPGVNRFPIQVAPEALAVFASEDGQFAIYGAADTYTISPELDNCWTLSTTPSEYEVAFDGLTAIDTLDFGVTPNSEAIKSKVTLTSAPTRCGFTVPFWLNYRNDGCWAFDGELYLVQHELATLSEATPAPSHTSGDTLFWSFSDLFPGQSRSVELRMTIAGVDFIGSAIEISTGIIPFNEVGQPLPPETFDFSSIINCAYDPNDKQVYPNRSEQAPFTQNYTLFDEILLYTLRFQNTGTDTAFNIVLRDQLSPALDWSTFQPGSSSHAYEASLHEDGLVEFHFRNILLPDSTTNEPGSHGFVQFEIKALPDLEEGTSIDNTAGIYFDFNPPIITNTINSMMVENLPDFTPAAAFTYTSEELTFTFTDASTNEPESWLWTFGDGNTSTEQNPVHIYNANGTYTVCLTVSNIWGTTQICEDITIVTTGADTPNSASTLRLQPNPTSGIVWIEKSTAFVQEEIVLYNAAGKALRSMILQQKTTRWDLSDLPAGAYWIRGDHGEVLPLVVVR